MQREEYERIVLGHTQRLYKTALAVVGNKGDAEDCVQECFLRLWEKSPAFTSDDHVTAWLIRVTVNLCKNRIGSPWRRRTVALGDWIPAVNNREHELLDTVGRLPPRDRAVIHLFYYEGYSTADIARITKQRESTVRSRLTRARSKLKGMLDNEPL